jgi:uncharacterized protein (DUF1800 family)
MKRIAYTLAGTVLLSALVLNGQTVDPFSRKLASDKQVVHVLNRLTFGPRPGDAAEVRRLGVEKWIDLQLHPEGIPENPALQSRLSTFLTLELPTQQIMERFGAPQRLFFDVVRRVPSIQTFLNPAQVTKLNTGTLEERQAILGSLTPEALRQVLALIPPQSLAGIPDLEKEAVKLRQEEAQKRSEELRRQMPPLMDLLSPDQIRTLRAGSKEEKAALLDALDAAKRGQVMRAAGPQTFASIPELRREAMVATQPQQIVNQELIEAKLHRALYSSRQLEQVLADFWLNHFNVFNGKGQTRFLLTSYERDAIRPHVLGRFKDMLLATARHPAMLVYLDNYLSQVPREVPLRSVAPNGVPLRVPGLNENYGREILELHTLGVYGGYTQDDVLAVARAFTGWTIYNLAANAAFTFNAANHDRSEKTVLGHTLPAGRGEEDGLDVIEMLARHPSTAKFISKKLAQRFVADDPPEALIDRMAAAFTRTDGDLRAVLQAMFSSPEFMSEGAWQAKLKSPLELTLSTARALDADVSDTFVLAQRIAELGQPIYGKVEPTGYPNTGESWASTSGILGRINFALAITGNQVEGVKTDLSRFNFKGPDFVSNELLGYRLPAASIAAIERGLAGQEATPSLLLSLVLSSPEFQRR